MASVAGRILFAGALGLACGSAFPAEWAIAPQVFGDADTQSNRTLRAGTPASQSYAAGFDLAVERRNENSELKLLNHYYLRRFTDDVAPDLDDERLTASWRLGMERSGLNFGAEYADESTLTTELAESGVVHADASRITHGASAGWNFTHSDARQFNASASYQDVDYTGGYVGELYGYQYAALSAGETFMLSSRTSLSVSSFGSRLDSPERGSESRELGVALGFSFAWTERLNVAAQLGVSRRDLDGDASQGGTGNLSITHRGETREFSLSYAQQLQPFATGVLTERETAELAFMQEFHSRLSSISRLGFARNEDAGFGTTFDSRNYRYANTELRWQLEENWFTSLVAGYATATDLGAPESVGGWSLIVRSLWTPNRHVIGH
jgi:hypothetical protein